MRQGTLFFFHCARWSVLLAGLLFLALAAGWMSAAQGGPALDYVLHCQGCHLPDGAGTPGKVPPLRNHVARFLAIPEGRAFLVQVPGVARANLSDERIAALLNWLVLHFDPDHVPKNFKLYTSEEVARLRRYPRAKVTAYRRALLERIAARAGQGDGP